MSKTQTERAWHSIVASLPCQLCGAFGSTVHHIREDQGMAQRSGHFLVVALCHDCHQGPNGIHGDRSLLRIYKTDELDLLNKTIGAGLKGRI